jgi:phage tail protein X
MAAETLSTQADDRLDLLCWRHYGHLRGSVEAVLAANYGLAAVTESAARLPSGLELTMPDLPPQARGLIRLW